MEIFSPVSGWLERLVRPLMIHENETLRYNLEVKAARQQLR